MRYGVAIHILGCSVWITCAQVAELSLEGVFVHKLSTGYPQGLGTAQVCRAVYTGRPVEVSRRACGCVSRSDEIECHVRVLGLVLRGGIWRREPGCHEGVSLRAPEGVVVTRRNVPSVNFIRVANERGIVITRLLPDFQMVCSCMNVILCE